MIYSNIRKLKVVSVNFGPQHPAAHGVLRLILEIVGERIVFCDPHIGLLHRGTEKLIEQKAFLKALPYFARLDYVSLMAQEHAFSLAIESLRNINLPFRVKFIRAIFGEISRILNHLMSLTTHALDVGALTPFLFGFEEREKLMGFYERVCGTRMHAAYIRPGGVNKDLPFGFLEDLHNFVLQFTSRISEIEELLTTNRLWRQRLINVGVVGVNEASSFGFSGVMLRSVGIKWDLRKVSSYEIYDKLKFEIPFSLNGDCYDRYLLRIEELRQSSKLILEVLNKVCFGEVKTSLFTAPIRFNLKSSMQSVINHFKFYSKGLVIFANEGYLGIEAPKGEFGLYLVSDDSSIPYRCKIRSPGFFHLQSINFLVKGQLIADVVTIIGSLDIVFGEIDR